MDLAPHVDELKQALAAAGSAGGAEAEAFLERFASPLESALRLSMLEVLSAAAEEISAKLAPGKVDLRLHGRNPDFIVTPPMASAAPPPAPEASPEPTDAPSFDPFADADDPIARISLRLPERLKAQVEEAAGREGLSTNAWLVRAIAGAVQGEPQRPGGRLNLQIGQGFSGWVR